jgi:hypothetical protein
VSLKRSVLLLSALFSIVGIGVSVIIIAIGGGFSGTGSSFLNPPDQSDLWTVGKTPVNSFSLQYLTTAAHELPYNATVWLNFTRLERTGWNVSLSIYNGSHNDEFSVLLSQNQLSRIGPVDRENLDSVNFLDKSIFVIRELARGPKYLITGAVWDKLLLDSGEVLVKIIDHNTLHTRAGVFDTFLLSYDVGPQESKIWISRDMPLPVRAQAFDSSGNLQYSYELIYKSDIVR